MIATLLANAATHAVSSQHYWLAAIIFLGVYALIISEKLEKTKAALLGAIGILGLGILDQQEAFYSEHLGIDYNVIFLLISMMIIVNTMGKSGVFEWAAVKIAKVAKGNPSVILALFLFATAITSALLDNVTTVMLVAPVTLMIADKLDLDPVPMLVLEALASNIGGTATLIGDPPNIMVGSKVGIGFSDFVVHLGPIVMVMLCAMILACHLLYGRKFKVDEAKRREVLAIDERTLIRDAKLMRRSLLVTGATIVGFLLHGTLHIEPATIALCGAVTLMVVTNADTHKTLLELEWPSIFFFIGLFIVVGGVVKVGLVTQLSQVVINLTGPTADSMMTTSMVMLWFSGIASGIIDNIPYVATMIPLITEMGQQVLGPTMPADATTHDIMHHATLMPVWWTLALGACLGGNATPIGASANVVVLGIAKKAGYHISFMRFVAVGTPVTLITLAMSTVYVYLRYF